MVQAALCGATFFPRPPRSLLVQRAHDSYYRCRDGRWLILTILNEERQWPVFARCLGLDSLVDDPRFAKQSDRFERAAELGTRSSTPPLRRATAANGDAS